MICLRCGHCCKTLWVVIVDDLSKGVADGNLTEHQGHGISCKHLTGKVPGKYSCAAHAKPWYKETPCARHGQIERHPKTKCRMGVYVLSKREPVEVG